MTIDLSTCRVGPAAAVSDMARARAFYEGTLRLPVKQEMGDSAITYRCGGDSELLVYVSEHAGQTAATIAGFEVPDVAAAVADLSGRGVAFERYDEPDYATDDRGILDLGEFKNAWFRDPDGNTFAVVGG